MPKICFSVKLDAVDRPIVKSVPEILHTTRLSAGHAEVVSEAGKVGLARHADANIVRDVVDPISGAIIIAYGGG
jgi:hypothetical protein